MATKSDIYSLGLVLYEIFTGRQAFEADTLNELIRKHKTAAPTNPSEFVKDIDPLVEQVILRCLEKDPEERPASAIQVALTLPGGDPLQAALAMGETPSPEVAAAAGEKTGLRPLVAVSCLSAVLACLVGLAFVSRRVSLIERIPFENSPEILASKGREAIAQLGYPERPFHRAYGLHYGYDYLRCIEQDSAPERWLKLEGGRGAITGWRKATFRALSDLNAPQPAADAGLDVLLGARFAVGDFLHSMGGAIFDPLGYAFPLTLLRVLLRRNWLAVALSCCSPCSRAY